MSLVEEGENAGKASEQKNNEDHEPKDRGNADEKDTKNSGDDNMETEINDQSMKDQSVENQNVKDGNVKESSTKVIEESGDIALDIEKIKIQEKPKSGKDSNVDAEGENHDERDTSDERISPWTNVVINFIEISIIVFFLILFIFVLPLPICFIERVRGGVDVWNYFNCIYFCTTTLTTVGYGDIVPETPGGRAYMIIYLLFGLAIVGALISKIGGYISSVTEDALKPLQEFLQWKFLEIFGGPGTDNDKLPFFSKKNISKRIADFIVGPRVKILLLFIMIIIYCLIGAVIFSVIEGHSYGDSLYYSIITVTTVGYGDISPQRVGGKIFFIGFSIVGIGLVGVLLGFLGEEMMKTVDKQKDKALTTVKKNYVGN